MFIPDQPLFTIGDVVQLRSGGPKMTITGGLKSAQIECLFYNQQQGLFQRHTFSPALLAKVPADLAQAAAPV